MVVLFGLSIALVSVGLFGLVAKKNLISKMLGVNTGFAGIVLLMILIGHKYESSIGLLLGYVIMFLSVINGVVFLSVVLNHFRLRNSVCENDLVTEE